MTKSNLTPLAGAKIIWLRDPQQVKADPAPDPTIIVTATLDRNGRDWLLTFECPWCPPRRGKPVQHTHPGGPLAGEPADGWRVSHCPERGKNGAPTGYTMVVWPPRTPIAFVSVKWSRRAKFWALTIERCPFCQKRHHHGGGTGPRPDLGYRASHCVEGPGVFESYELVEAGR